ncbi:MAG TPA: extracellular solute-binding protein [Pseudonocardia sp.]|nr:extracellular solute-binding protein [Pseudonocardia sp.]
MSRLTRRVGYALGAVIVLALSACGGGSESGGGGGGTAGDQKRITVWTGDTLPDRVDATKKIIERFTAATGVQVELVGVDEDQFNQTLTSAAAAGELPDVIGSQPLASVRTLSANELIDTAATAQVVEALGADTFDQRALELTRDGDAQLAVPTDAWAQLLYYRKDLFDAAGLPAPTSYDAILNAARTLNKPGLAGFAGATAAGDAFTQQTFEHVALANGCELVDPAGEITIAGPPCVGALGFYQDLITNYSVPGAQDVDTVRATYFAGQASMIVWSTFLLDELAGLRNDALPSCPECAGDPKFLAANTGIVTGLQGPDGAEPAQFGEVSSWAIPVDADAESAKQFVQFMLSDGYVDWLAIAPEGKFPVRPGPAAGSTEYVEKWKTLPVGVDTEAPLAQVYGPEVLTALEAGPKAFTRWGITQGQGDLIGASLGELPVAGAVAAVTGGGATPQAAADEAAGKLRAIQDTLR